MVKTNFLEKSFNKNTLFTEKVLTKIHFLEKSFIKNTLFTEKSFNKNKHFLW